MINKKRLIETFKKLVAIDSPSLQESKVVCFVIGELRGLGLKPRQVGKPRGGEAGNVVVDLPARGPRLLLNAHLDTVAHDRPIVPVKKNGYFIAKNKTILGADNKAGVAALLEILRTITERRLPHPHLRVIFTVAEEIGLMGAKALPKYIFSAEYGLVLDGGEINEIIHKAPSQKNIIVTVHGKAAHAGIHPEQGVNAIKVAAEAITKMKLGRIDHETTANIGVIEGGAATNIIPDKVVIKGEARSHDREKLEKQIKHMKDVLIKTCRKYKARPEIKVKEMYRAFEIGKSETVIQLAVRALKKAGLKPVIKQTGGGSDANIFNAAGLPTIIMGVGAGHVHTSAERIKIADLVRGTEIVLDLICHQK